MEISYERKLNISAIVSYCKRAAHCQQRQTPLCSHPTPLPRHSASIFLFTKRKLNSGNLYFEELKEIHWA